MVSDQFYSRPLACASIYGGFAGDGKEKATDILGVVCQRSEMLVHPRKFSPNESLKTRAGRNFWRNSVGYLLVPILLFAPSLWMLSSIPPLWKDCDANLQVTSAPDSGISLHYAPVNCFLPRLPLYAGYAFAALREHAPLPSFRAFFVAPILSDNGVWLLLFCQHAALCAAATFFIFSVTCRLVVRLSLALLWAANPLFYIWAQCVSSEAPSLVLVLLLAAIGLRLVRQSGRRARWLWIAVGLLLTVTMLTRHINAVLAATLPLTFGFISVTYFLGAFRQKSAGARRCFRLRALRAMRSAGVATLIGIISILVANASLRGIARSVGLRYHNTAGFTFMFRLNFLAPLPPDARARITERAIARSRSADVRTLLEVYRDGPAEHFDIMALMDQARARLRPDEDDARGKFFEVMSLAERSFLVPPIPELWQAASRDFFSALPATLPKAVMQPFLTTVTFFDDPTRMPQCENLVTFRNRSRAEILAPLASNRYLRIGRKVEIRRLLIGGLIALVLAAALGKRSIVPACAYAASLTLVGLLMLFATCLVNEFQSRYSLPLWELSLIALAVLLGAIADSFRARSG